MWTRISWGNDLLFKMNVHMNGLRSTPEGRGEQCCSGSVALRQYGSGVRQIKVPAIGNSGNYDQLCKVHSYHYHVAMKLSFLYFTVPNWQNWLINYLICLSDKPWGLAIRLMSTEWAWVDKRRNLWCAFTDAVGLSLGGQILKKWFFCFCLRCASLSLCRQVKTGWHFKRLVSIAMLCRTLKFSWLWMCTQDLGGML